MMKKIWTNINKRSGLQFLLFVTILSILFSLVIYLRESTIKNQIAFTKVFLWQMIIWSPWVIVFYILPKVREGLRRYKYGDVLYYGSSPIWVCLHFGWFFIISSNYSPYLGMPATGYGVYPYFFIFWTFIDIIIVSIIYAYNKYGLSPKTSKPFVLELTRGGETFFCNPDEIYWLSSDNYYTHLYTIHGKFIMRKTLKFYHEHIKFYKFLQIHRSTIVNMNYVKGLTKSKNTLSVILKDGTKKTVSKKNQSKVRSIFKNQLS